MAAYINLQELDLIAFPLYQTQETIADFRRPGQPCAPQSIPKLPASLGATQHDCGGDAMETHGNRWKSSCMNILSLLRI